MDRWNIWMRTSEGPVVIIDRVRSTRPGFCLILYFDPIASAISTFPGPDAANGRGFLPIPHFCVSAFRRFCVSSRGAGDGFEDLLDDSAGGCGIARVHIGLGYDSMGADRQNIRDDVLGYAVIAAVEHGGGPGGLR